MRTPLHFAADRGHPAMISSLLALGAAVDPRDADGMTPLAYAVACDNEKEIEVLVRRSTIATLTREIRPWEFFQICRIYPPAGLVGLPSME